MAEQLMIDTLGMADKLESSGFAQSQAEGLARALGEELSERLASQPQFSMTATELRGEIASIAAGKATEIGQLRTRMNEMETRMEALEARMDRLEAKLDGEFKAIHTKLWFLCSALGLLETFS